MLLVQQYLETHTLGDLVRDHGVYASFSKSGHKFSLNYDQIEAKESDPLAQECRGLILSLTDGQHIVGVTDASGRTNRDHVVLGPTKILAYPMKRFFNHGQGSAAEINWSDPNLAVLEKLDGTLCIVYWDNWTSKWCVATRSVPEADMLMDNGIYTFRTLFEKAVTDTTGYEFDVFTRYLEKSYTYCFELTTPYNRIVVEYKNNGVTLLAVRGLCTLQELDFKHPVIDLLPTSLPLVQAHTYTTVQELVDWVSTLNPMEHEGVVVRDGNFNRIKVKNAAYVAYNKVRDALATSPRNMVELILLEKDDDVVPMLPEEIVKNLQKIKAGLKEVMWDYDEWYKVIRGTMEIRGVSDKKSFALLVQEMSKQQNGHIWQAPFFNIFDGKSANMRDFIKKSCKDGSWGNSFLDKMLELSNK